MNWTSHTVQSLLLELDSVHRAKELELAGEIIAHRQKLADAVAAKTRMAVLRRAMEELMEDVDAFMSVNLLASRFFDQYRKGQCTWEELECTLNALEITEEGHHTPENTCPCCGGQVKSNPGEIQ